MYQSLFMCFRLNIKRTSAPEPDCDEDIQSQEGNPYEETTAEVIYTTVDFDTKRKPNMEQQMVSHTGDDSVIYSTVCRNQPII